MITQRVPYAPSHLKGLGNTAPQGVPYPDQAYTIPVSITMTGNQTNLLTYQDIERDADFIWRGFIVGKASAGTATSDLYSVQMDINGWYKLSPAQILAGNLQSDPSAPFPVFPELPVPAGGRIGILTSDLSGSTNTIQLLLLGVKRFKQGAR